MPITFRWAVVLCATVLLSFGRPAAAEVVIGHKNDPTIQLGRNLAGLLGAKAPSVETDPDHQLSDVLRRSGAVTIALPEYTAAYVAALPRAAEDGQWNCLTEALYFEARGEAIRGVFAVAEVILNRVDSPRFPDSICGVVNQGTGKKWRCQFTYTCDGLAEIVHEKAAWRRMGKIARFMIDGGARPLTRGAMYYHTRAVHPYWARVFDRTTTIGAHHFYAQG